MDQRLDVVTLKDKVVALSMKHSRQGGSYYNNLEVIT